MKSYIWRDKFSGTSACHPDILSRWWSKTKLVGFCLAGYDIENFLTNFLPFDMALCK